jgi:hypothetical protein
MRSCEYTKTARPGCTKLVQIGCVVFCTCERGIIAHTDPSLLSIPEFITIVFEDQKNGKKMDAHTQRRSGHRFLCPILRWCSPVQPIIATVPDWNDQTNLCSVYISREVLHISNAFVQKLLRHTCLLSEDSLSSDSTPTKLATDPSGQAPPYPSS